MANKSTEKGISEALITQAQKGNDAALEKIFAEFRPYIKSLSGKYFLAGADAEDVIQEGMIGLFGAIRDYSLSEGTSFDVFARMCIRRRIQTAVRTANRKKHQPLNSSVSLQSPAFEAGEQDLSDIFAKSDSSPEEIYINNETASLINKLIYNSLSKLELQILLLYNNNMSYKEISEITGKSVKSVDNAVQRVKKKVSVIKKQYMSL